MPSAGPSAARADRLALMSAPADQAPFADAWVVLPTYNESQNLPGISAAILHALPGAHLLVVDDASPDGTGQLADGLAAGDPRIAVLHRGRQGRPGQGLHRRLRRRARARRRPHRPDGRRLVALARLPARPHGRARCGADLVIGSRYARGGGVRDWGLLRRLVSRGGSIFARIVLRLAPHDLTGGFKAWRRTTLEVIDWGRVHSGGYVFQIETTYLASRAGARVVEVPIVFHDRQVGSSKMSRSIILEALVVVLRLRWDELRGRGPQARLAVAPATIPGLSPAPAPHERRHAATQPGHHHRGGQSLRVRFALPALGHDARVRRAPPAHPGLVRTRAACRGGAGATCAAHPPRHRSAHQLRVASLAGAGPEPGQSGHRTRPGGTCAAAASATRS